MVLSIHQPSFRILSVIDGILLLSKGCVIHHGTLSTLKEFLVSNEFSIPPQLNPLEFAMEILDQLTPTTTCVPPDLPPVTGEATPRPDYEENPPIKYRSSRLHEILTLHWRFWMIIFRTRQLLLTNTLEALIVGIVLGNHSPLNFSVEFNILNYKFTINFEA